MKAHVYQTMCAKNAPLAEWMIVSFAAGDLRIHVKFNVGERLWYVCTVTYVQNKIACYNRSKTI